ncbi:MAG: hypothetical protein HGB12_04725 [Bacteroidetes bacterium]|nr:hypothetical protein [Bacteroidota bacterium]
MKKIIFLFLFFFVMFEVMCQKSIVTLTYFNDLEKDYYDQEWMNLSTKTTGEGLSGKYFSRTNSNNPYGLGYGTVIPSQLTGKNFWLHTNCYCRTDISDISSSIVISVTRGDSTIFWKGITIKNKLNNLNKWIQIKDSVLLPASLPADSKISIYLWSYGIGNTDIDDFKISFETAVLPSYLIETNTLIKSNEAVLKNIFNNKFYSFFYSQTDEQILIKNRIGAPIISSLILFAKYKNLYDNKSDSFFVKKIKKIKIKKKSNELKFIFEHQIGATTIVFRFSDSSPNIELITNTIFDKDIELFRESLVLQFEDSVDEIYRNNRKVDTSDFQAEYWLDKEGLKFGKGNSATYIYHCPKISSLQLNTDRKQLVINLDYYKDHPLLYFPLLDSAKNYFEDISSSVFHKNECLENKITFYTGCDMGSFPRLMKSKDGYFATYIWTEHADWTDINTHKAVYFGSEKINNSNDAIGGFVKYKIPVTKSVFYYNPDSIRNSQSSTKVAFNSLIQSLKGFDDFENFIDQLYLFGNEICLHTPEQSTGNRKILDEALSFMQKKYNSVSWIDHGYDNSITNNRENMQCDGLTKGSANYSLDIWDKYGIKYLWNSYFEDTECYSTFNFSSSLTSPYYGFGDMFPVPEYWLNPTRSGNIYSWKTSSVLNTKGGNLWEYFFNNATLMDLVNNRDVLINHCYPAAVWSNNGFWIINDSSEIVVNPAFDSILKLMRVFGDEKLINFTTVRDYLDYNTSLEDVVITPVDFVGFKVINNGKKNIKGISFIMKCNAVLVDNQSPEYKKSGSDIIFWFDLDSGQSKIISGK